MNFRVVINVMPKEGISDPQGQTIEGALPALGFMGITSVRVGKRITFDLEATDESAARSNLQRACEKFLSNPIIEDYEIEIHEMESAI